MSIISLDCGIFGKEIEMTKKRKILQIGDYPPPMGGIAVRTKMVNDCLLRHGYETTVLNIGRYMKQEIPGCVSVLNGWDYAWKVMRYVLKGYIPHIRLNAKSWKGALLTLYAEIIAFLFNNSASIVFHAGVKQQYFPKDKTNTFMKLIFKLIFVFARKIICNNDAVKEKIIEYGINGDKIVPIPSFSSQHLEYEDVALSSELEVFLRDRFPLLFSYLCVRPEFEIEMLLQGIKSIAKKYPKLGVVLVRGMDDNVNKLLESIELYGVKDIVLPAGYLSRDMFLTLLKKSTLMVRTPNTDGVCSTILEAIAFDIPVVASDNGNRPKGIILFRSGDSLDMVEKIIYVLENYDKVKEEIVNGEDEVSSFKARDTLKEEMDLLMEK